ncbi:hypothetical protein CDD83_3020 [Cordyceps sp. RAO-2017]|nr:hypothetical protein CDD83_3020 [Cordyceps sp. RAO-2017]
MSKTQTAVFVTEIGKPVVRGSRPVPSPSNGQVLVKVTTTGLNALDALGRNYGLLIQETLPAVLGADVAGVVAEVGPDVTTFKQGDRIFGQAALQNSDSRGLQEYALLDAQFAAKSAAGFSDGQMASFPTNLVTAAVSLFDESALGIPAPWTEAAAKFDYGAKSILIIGGGSNTGRYAIQLAALAGFGKIIVVASAKKASEIRSLGATHVVDRSSAAATIVTEIRNVAGDDLLFALDTIQQPDAQFIGVDALSNTKKGKLARLLTQGPVPAEKLSSEKQAGYEVKDVFGSSHAMKDTAAPLWARLTAYVEGGKIRPLTYAVIKGLDVEAINRKLDGYSDGSTSGQCQVQMD